MIALAKLLLAFWVICFSVGLFSMILIYVYLRLTRDE